MKGRRSLLLGLLFCCSLFLVLPLASAAEFYYSDDVAGNVVLAMSELSDGDLFFLFLGGTEEVFDSSLYEVGVDGIDHLSSDELLSWGADVTGVVLNPLSSGYFIQDYFDDFGAEIIFLDKTYEREVFSVFSEHRLINGDRFYLDGSLSPTFYDGYEGTYEQQAEGMYDRDGGYLYLFGESVKAIVYDPDPHCSDLACQYNSMLVGSSEVEVVFLDVDWGEFFLGDYFPEELEAESGEESVRGGAGASKSTTMTGTDSSISLTTSSTSSPPQAAVEEPAPREFTGLLCDKVDICRQLHEVWQVLHRDVFRAQGVDELYWKAEDRDGGEWVSWTTLYPIAATVTYDVCGEPASASSLAAQYQDEIEAAVTAHPINGLEREEQIALTKAIIERESNFEPHAISLTGCSGLMQVCWPSSYIANDREVACCPGAELGEVALRTNCLNERTACGGSIAWCAEGGYDCSPSTDDRLSAGPNIMAGTQILGEKFSSIGNCGTERVKAAISAYNLGQAAVKEAINANGGNCNIWKDVYAHLADNFYEEENRLFDLPPQNYYTSFKIENQRDACDAYVGRVYASYLGYLENPSVS